MLRTSARETGRQKGRANTLTRVDDDDIRGDDRDVVALTVRAAQELQGVPYDRPRRGARDFGSQRLHAPATETEVYVAQEQEEEYEKQRHLQYENT